VADTQEVESLVKREPEVPAKDPIVSRSTSGIMLLSAILMTASLAWALWDETYGQRPWKKFQREFVARYTRYLQSIKSQAGRSETEIKESAEYQNLADAEKVAREKIKPDVEEIDAKLKNIGARLAAVTEPFQDRRGRLTVINYNIETAQGAAKDRYRRQAENKKKELVEVHLPPEAGSGKPVEQQLNYQQLETLYNDLRDEKADLLGRKAVLLMEPAELAK